MTDHLFDSGGNWIAYRVQDRWVWSKDGKLIGWCPWNDEPDLAVRVNGNYLGHIVENRLLRKVIPALPWLPRLSRIPGLSGPRRVPAVSSRLHGHPSRASRREGEVSQFDGCKLKPDSRHPEGRSASNWYRVF